LHKFKTLILFDDVIKIFGQVFVQEKLSDHCQLLQKSGAIFQAKILLKNLKKVLGFEINRFKRLLTDSTILILVSYFNY